MATKTKNRRVSPFAIQCFVTAGMSLNMAELGLVLGFSTGLLPQLRRPDSDIVIDDIAASWIASLPGLAIVVGNFIMPSIMSNFGRRTANLCSLGVIIAGWLCIVFSNSVTFLIMTRFLQGIGMGMIATLGPVLIGEYTSPNNRGLFLMTLSVTISIAVCVIQAMSAYLQWKTCAIACIGYALCNAVIVIFSPESPTFLADKERYDECRTVFRYLRGDTEDQELEKMIATRIMAKKEQVDKGQSFKDVVNTKLTFLKQTIKKKEFFKPILIMLHVYAMAQWCGVNALSSFTNDIFKAVVGFNAGVNIPLMIVIVGVHRIIANILGMFLIKALKRRVMLFSTIGLNSAALLALAAYTYAKDNNLLPFDQPAVGVFLVHIHMFAVATGAIPLGFVLAGELYPMEYKGLCGGISMLFFSMHLFSNTKTVLMFFNLWGIYGTYCLYAGVLIYCLIVVGILLPETKDKTLQDIEEFRGKSTPSSKKNTCRPTTNKQ